MVTNYNTYFEVSLEYPNGYVETLFAKEISIESGYPQDDEFAYVRFDRTEYLGPRTTEIKYKNHWGGTVLMQVPHGTTTRYRKWTGDVWWVEENGKRVSPIWDKVDDVYKERVLYPNGTLIVKTFKEVEDE